MYSKSDYYLLLQETRTSNHWEPWLLYMLDGVEVTAKQTIHTVERIKQLMMDYKHRFRDELPKIYSQDFINILFRHPYTKVGSVMEELQVGRLTAAKYLNLLTEHHFLQKHKVGRYNYYINAQLFDLFTDNHIRSPIKD